jgi:hypothetical protein
LRAGSEGSCRHFGGLTLIHALDRNFTRGGNAEPDNVAVDFQNCDGDEFSDPNLLPDIA